MILHSCKMKLIIISLIISVLSETTGTSGGDLNNCDSRGTKRIYENGKCQCKDLVTGKSCNQCKPGKFFLSSKHRLGCIPCHCMQITRNCTSSNFNWDKIHLADRDLLKGIFLYSPTKFEGQSIEIIRSGFFLDSNQRGVSYNGFPSRKTQRVYYWSLPAPFLGSRVTSYGGNLTYTIQYVSSSNTEVEAGVQVYLRNSGRGGVKYLSAQSVKSNSSQTFTIVLLEEFWTGSRFPFMQTLANITAIEIRATYTKYTDAVFISNVSLDIATNSGNRMEKAVEVENCTCPIGYSGFSCEVCTTGYTRDDRTRYSTRTCIPCNCNNNSKQCDPETGVCQNCERYTTGKNCERCEDDYEGDPTEEGCLSPESQSIVKLSPKCSCNPAGSRNNECPNGACECKSDVVGLNCDYCRQSTFGLSKDNVNGCNDCFCSGVTKQCHESVLHIQRIIPNCHNVNECLSLVYTRTGLPVKDDNLVIKESTQEMEYSYGANTQSFPVMWSFPAIFTGNKITSYGGNLEFSQKITADRTSAFRFHWKVTLKGNGITLIRRIYSDQSFVNKSASYSIPLRESQWRNSTNSWRVTRSTKTDLMKVLSNLEGIFIVPPSAQNIISISISNVGLDTAVNDFPQGDIATQVEVCTCPPEYLGTSCESCSRGYYRDITDQSLSVFGACKICPCNDHAESCEMREDSQIHCYCTAGYTGEFCQFDEHSETTEVDSNTCDPRGTWRVFDDGTCICKELVEGVNCNQCTTGSFFLSSESPSGCRSCFCSGLSDDCTSSKLNRDKIYLTDSDLSASISLSAPYLGDLIITSGFVLDSNQRGISYAGFPEHRSQSDYYWILPPPFLGNLNASYGGNLTYKIQYATPQASQRSGHAPDVILRTANRGSIRYYFPQSPQPGPYQEFTVALLEEFWGESRHQFLNALINITAIEIRATYRMYTESTSISDVSLDTATYSDNGMKKALEVEECKCPTGYTGLSCEKCATGYTRPETRGYYLETCTPCKCNGHSKNCDPETGVCENCEHNTAGRHCELCKPGYERKTPIGDCMYQHPEIVPRMPNICNCNPLGSKNNECDDKGCPCKSNVEGPKCDYCRWTTFGLSGDNVNGCNECFCSGRTKLCRGSSLHIHPITPDFLDADDIFGLVDAETESPVSRDNVHPLPLLNQIQYQYGPKTRGRQLMWSLSGIFTGNQVKSYGGYLKLAQKFTSHDLPNMRTSQKVILKSNELTLSWRTSVDFTRDNFVNFLIPLRESQWTRSFGDRGESESTRAELMTALSDLQAIFVFAPFDKGIDSISISNVSLDTAVDNFPGDKATQVEICSCPDGYSGTSCESCSPGYYRNVTKRSIKVPGHCLTCPCTAYAESCKMDDNGAVKCHCASGYTGKYCQERHQRKMTPLHIQSEPAAQLVSEGCEAAVNCTVNDDDSDTDVTWMKYGENHLGLHAHQYGRTLRISETGVFDGGMYVCRARRGETYSEQTAVIKVSPRAVPVLKVYPQDFHSVLLGDSVSLQCQDVSGHDQTSAVQWAREDGVPFPSNVVLRPNGILQITNIKIENNGTYQCSATNEVKTARAIAQVEVKSIPVITISPNIGGEVRVKLDGSVTLVCTADGLSKPDVIWSRYTVATGEIQLLTLKIPNFVTYEITSMSGDDVGIYVCTATNSAGTSEKKIYVKIDYASLPPIKVDAGIRISPNHLKIPVRKTVQMKCEVVGSDFRAIYLHWQRSNGLAIPRDRIQNGLLTIQQVTKMDAGRYICLGLSSYGSELYRATSYLEVIPLPRIILTPSNETVNLGTTQAIHCIATGDGTITTKWTAIGQELLPRNVEDDKGVLKFHGIDGGHIGKYLCNATNEAGSVMQVAQVLFEPQVCN